MAYTIGRKIVKEPGESLDKFEDGVNQVNGLLCVQIHIHSGL